MKRMSTTEERRRLAHFYREEQETRPAGVVTAGAGSDYERVRSLRVKHGLAVPEASPGVDIEPPPGGFRILDVRPAGWCENPDCTERGARLTEDMACPYCGWTPV